MGAGTRGRQRRSRGEIETLPSGSLRVKVYAGSDPLTGRRHYLSETVPAGPTAESDAEQARTRLLNQVDERRNPRTKATVNQLFDRYLELLDVDITTKRSYEGYIRNHIRPLLGKQPVGKLDGETLDSFYVILRTCRAHCDGHPYIEHRTQDTHDCDEHCKPHECRPLATSSIRQIHWCLSAAFKAAIRWRWIATNPLDQAHAPRAATSDPRPPTPEQAAAILNEAFRDVGWGMLVWLAMTTGARRGEICAFRWDLLDLHNALLSIRSSIGQTGSVTWEKDTKTHQQRRIALDKETVTLLRAYQQHCETEAAAVGSMIAKEGRVFSPSIDHTTWLKPDSVSQRYSRMCARLDLDMNIHQLRHYSATELISAGVDVRTVAGRLGHGGGGATTLRVYSAWLSEADQRAAGNLASRMPAPPTIIDADGSLTTTQAPKARPRAHQHIAADLRGAISAGTLKPGDHLPTVKELADRYRVAFGTAQLAIAELKSTGLVLVSRGQRAIVSETNIPSAGHPGPMPPRRLDGLRE